MLLSRVTNRRFVALVVVAMVAVRLSYLVSPLRSDEAGYLLVARSWRLGGPNLYGHYFVDRPPLLIAIFKVASWVSWPEFVRVLALPFCVLLVVSAAWTAQGLGGRWAARWAAVIAAAFAVSPLLGGVEADGELFAAPLVMLSVGLILAAARRSSIVLGFAAGLSAGAAVLMKQNFVDGVVFGVALLIAAFVQGRITGRAALRVGTAGLAGGAAALIALVGFTVWSRVSLTTAYFALFGLRETALDVIEDHDGRATSIRALLLVVLALLSGLLPLLVALVRNAGRTGFRGTPVAWAIGVTLTSELAAIAAGGSYWSHYLIQLVPMITLAAALWAGHDGTVRTLGVYAVAASLVATVGLGVQNLNMGSPASRQLGVWLGRSAAPGDTATVLYGHAEILQAAGLSSPYDQLWSLPLRTMDPHLTRLRTVLDGPRAPTWVVAWSGLDTWDIDPHDTTRLTVVTRYHLVAEVCGRSVWLRDGVRRELAPRPSCS